jgi:hypothetical protein
VRRTLAIAAVVTLGVAGAPMTALATSVGHAGRATGAAGASGSQQARPASEHVPRSVHRAELTKRNGIPSHQVQHGVVTAAAARKLVGAFDALKAAKPGVYNCPADRGLRKIADFRGDGHVWVATEGSCGISVTRDGKKLPALSEDNAYNRDLAAAFATMRPKQEHVPQSVHKADLTYRSEPTSPVSRRRTVTGNQATDLVKDFDALKRQPPHAVHCDVAGGPEQTVTFATSKHTWVATQSACTNVMVTRDGKALPTLIASQKWSNDLQRYLGNGN